MIQHWLLWLVGTTLLWYSLKKFLPEKVFTKIDKHKGYIFIVYTFLSFLVIGSPYRMEATELTGEVRFSQPFDDLSEKVNIEKKDLTQTLEEGKINLRKQQEETQNEVNN
jgi:hypothetical protein